MKRQKNWNQLSVITIILGETRKDILKQAGVLSNMSMTEIVKSMIDDLFDQWLEKRGLTRINGNRIIRL
jgi:hypothetical protein